MARKTIQRGRTTTRTAAQTTQKLDNSQQLYNLAVQNGLQKDANRIMESQTGETNRIFSGGFISDIFDVLNSLQYGVTGVLKGKSFVEGVKTRQSFSDKDALGDNGIPGVVAGIALDIAVDPLTYIAPATIVKKIPGAVKLGKIVKSSLFGSKVKKAIQVGEGVAPKTYEALEGGNRLGKMLADKVSWMFGADPVFKETWERTTKNIASGTMNIADLAKGVSKIAPKTAKKIFTADKQGRLKRVPLDTLRKVLKPDELENVSALYNKIDDLGKQAVDAGLLSKSKYEENLGEYVKNAYLEYEQAKGKGIFGFMRAGIKGIKGRKAVENISEFGLTQVDNPAYLLFKSNVDLIKDIENAKLFKIVNSKFGTDIAQEGFKQLPKTARITTTTGAQVDILTDIKKVNQEIKPTIKELSRVFSKDKETLSLIKSIESTIGELSGKRADELTKFFSAPLKAVKTTGGGQVIKGVGKLPDNLKELGDAIKKFDKFSDLMKSNTGIKLEKLFEEGVLERAGFTEIEDLFKFVKNSYKKIPEVTKEVVQKGNLPKVVQLQRQIEELTPKLSNLKNIDKKSIDDAYRYFEETLNTLSGKKEALVEELEILKLGDLAGKYVPENMYDYIQEISDPVKYTLGKKMVADFKFFKVVMNPATHARNIVSNSILNWWKLGIGPWNVQKYASAVKDIAKNSDDFKRFQKVGGGLDTMTSNEILSLLDDPQVAKFGSKIGNIWKNSKKFLGDIYQNEESVAKLVAFKEMVKKGFSDEKALQLAEQATFNYAQVTPFVRKLRTSLFGFPFITFTLKSTPLAVETIVKTPRRVSVFGKIKNSLEDLADIKETERERASEPPWVRDGFYIKLPIKDKHGRSAYFDLTYIIPFGDLVSGNFIERQIKRDTGIKESLGEAALSKSPSLNFIKEISRNQDFYGNKIWKDSDSSEKQLKDLFRHFTKTYLPPLVADQIPGGYNKKGERTQRGFVGAVQSPSEEINQKRTLTQELLRQVGAKIQPIDAEIQETYQEWNRKKALEHLLTEKGVISQFQKYYIPK